MDAEDGCEVETEILYPANPGSVYHMTKTLDQLLFAFYAKNDEVRVTDLHQGIVWGTQTPETSLDERLINRFDYDGDYGTVLNRFLMQAAIGYPLTVHGTGGQTRAFIHIRDTVKCIRLAVESPPERGERPRIFNQMTEVHRVIDLAGLVVAADGRRDRPGGQPAQGGQPQRPAGRQRPPARARPGPGDARGRPAVGGHRDRAALRGPLRPLAHPLHVAVGVAAGDRAGRRAGDGLGRCDSAPASRG